MYYKLVKDGVLFVRKDKSRLMRAVGAILGDGFKERMWTTIRLPFCAPRIYYPVRVTDPAIAPYDTILQHEAVHVEQFRPWYGPVLVAFLYVLAPLPVGFSGRWLIERPAYLHNIIHNGYSVEFCVQTLKRNYFYPWPESWMRKWFNQKALEAAAV